MSRLQLLFASLLLAYGSQLKAGVVLSFESLTDLELVTNQFPGLTFVNTVALTAGISLNEIDFPPHSGLTAVSDDGGPITILFSSPILSFGGYFTYTFPLSMEAFSPTDVSVATSNSLFSANYTSAGIPGSSPNEFLEVASLAGISRVVITGDSFGGSFVMDDAEYTSAVPEPSALGLLCIGIICLVIRRSKYFKCIIS